MMKISSITKSFGGIKALDDCTLNIEKGQCIALIGPNGSGKSTLFNIISHLIEKDHGKIILNNVHIKNPNEVKIAKAGVARTFQEVQLFPNLTIEEHMHLALTKNESLLKALIEPMQKKEKRKQRMQEILNFVQLKKDLQTYASELSYGQRKLLDIAMAIAQPHEILLLDEPVAGVNPLLREKIQLILRQLHKAGETILLIEHDMNFVMNLVEYIFVLDNGKVIAEGTPKEIQNNARVLNAYLGE